MGREGEEVGVDFVTISNTRYYPLLLKPLHPFPLLRHRPPKQDSIGDWAAYREVTKKCFYLLPIGCPFALPPPNRMCMPFWCSCVIAGVRGWDWDLSMSFYNIIFIWKLEQHHSLCAYLQEWNTVQCNICEARPLKLYAFLI